jgi:hypothetical protein
VWCRLGCGQDPLRLLDAERLQLGSRDARWSSDEGRVGAESPPPDSLVKGSAEDTVDGGYRVGADPGVLQIAVEPLEVLGL